MAEKSYSYQEDVKNIRKLRDLEKELPPYAADYFRGIQERTQTRTRVAYAYDLITFFRWLRENNPVLGSKSIQDITLEDLENLTASDIEEYEDYLQDYTGGPAGERTERTNRPAAVKRKLSALSSFFRYFQQKGYIRVNPISLVNMPKLRDHAIIRFDGDETAEFLDHVDEGTSLTDRQQAWHEKTRLRDLAMMTLMLGTGIRVSECVGLNLKDVSFNDDSLLVHRKGGKESILYFGDEVELPLLDYLEWREDFMRDCPEEQAFFVSLQKRRITVRAVENLVKKYAQTVQTTKHITPHKLRSTYGTSLYRQTGDIYLVANVLGHSDVNTTQKHYAAIVEDRRRNARNAVRLRPDRKEEDT